MFSSRHTFHRATLCILSLLLILVLNFIDQLDNTYTVLAAPHMSSTRQRPSAAADNTAVTTYKEDTERSGNHGTETILTTTNVNQNAFRKRVSYPVDGQMYTQPLFLPNVTINGTSHNVVYVATEHDSVYAFDADSTSPIASLWHTSFLNSPSVSSPSNIDVSCNDIIPENGLSGTPVIDRSTGTLYVVVLTMENGSLIYRLHALDITTGQEKPGSPTLIQASVPGTGDGSTNGTVTFNPKTERQRAALTLANGNIYIAWGSFCDNNPHHGWIMSYSYDGSQFQQVNVYNNTANSTQGGIWGAGGAISADSNGNIYYSSGNGGFDANTGGVDYGDSFVKLNAQLQVLDYFTPFNQQCLESVNGDLGSGGSLLLPNQNRLIGAGKEGRIYVINTTDMGHYNTVTNPCANQSPTNIDKVVQELPPATIGGLFSTPVYWRNASGQQFVYFGGRNDSTKAFPFNNSTLATAPSSKTPEIFGYPGSNPTISSNNGATGTGILWTLDATPALRAFDATNLSKELYNSTQNPTRDGLESYVKFSVPTIANGEVFVGTKTSLDIFGLLSTPFNEQAYTGGFSQSGTTLYQLHSDGAIWQYVSSSATGWVKLNQNSATVAIAADGNGNLYQLDNNGNVYRFTGTTTAPSWQLIDAFAGNIALAVSGNGQVYLLHTDGAIFLYTGTPHSWQQLDHNPTTRSITVDTSGNLYQFHSNGSIWKYVGPPITGWARLDNNPATVAIAANGNGNLYQLHNNGAVYRFTGTTTAPSWQLIDAFAGNIALAVSQNNQVYLLHTNGYIYIYTGTPHSWRELDHNPATTAISAGGNGTLYQLHATNGAIWIFTGTPTSPSWKQIDHNAATLAISGSNSSGMRGA